MMEITNALRNSRRCYYWLLAWAIVTCTWLAGMARWGEMARGPIEAILWTTFICSYMFFIDISHKIWWTADQIWCRGWDYLAIKPMRHTVRVDELINVVTANHPANWVPGCPFDRFELVGLTDKITILVSFHQREELEALLYLIYERRPEVFVDPKVLEFMNGGFAEWWRYR